MDCTSCGSAKAHPLAVAQGKVMCRYCTEKSGNMWVFHRMIDIEKLHEALTFIGSRTGQSFTTDEFFAFVESIKE